MRMKNLRFFLFFLPILLLNALQAQGLAEISRALGQGDVATVSRYLDAEIELSILGADDFYSKAAASTQLQSFLAKYPVAKFAQIHKGVSPTTKAEYCIGNLDAGGQTFRVVIYMTEVAGTQKIKKMSFDKE